MMTQKIKKILDSNYIKSLQDVRSIGLLIFSIIVLIVTWSGIKVVQTNYDLQKKIAVMKQQNGVKKIENSNIALRNKYLETDEYLELVARKQFNKALPGETLVIVPKSVAMKYAAELKDLSIAEPAEGSELLDSSGSRLENNYNAWLDFLFRRE